MKYNKLVRNKIIDIIKNNGENPIFHIADDLEFDSRLNKKLQEEVSEYLEDNCEDELADIYEVLESIIEFKGFDKDRIEKLRRDKKQKRGGFRERIILDDVA